MIKKIIIICLLLLSIINVCYAEDYCFIGDSRFVEMRNVVNNEDIYFCDFGVGYDFYWENKNSILNLSKENTIIIYNLGMNDLNAKKHVEAINDLFNNGFERVIFMTINPVDEIIARTHGYSLKNNNIDAFNQYIKENVVSNVMFLNSNKFLKENGFNTLDGIHYSNDTYTKIYDYLFSYL